jgi:hypothetical protein
MDTVTLDSHFDGKHIHLDEPFEFKSDAKLIITVLSNQKIEDDREAWLSLSAKGLKNAYAEDEFEYTLDMIKRPNPDYDKR